MKRQLFLIPLVAFFAACATDDLGMGETPSNPMADVDPLTVPLDDALGEMYSLMNDIYGASTRAAQRTVADVATSQGAVLPFWVPEPPCRRCCA